MNPIRVLLHIGLHGPKPAILKLPRAASDTEPESRC